MGNFWTVYRYELKKLLKKRLLWVTALLCLAGIVIMESSSLIGTYYVDGEAVESNYEGFLKDRRYRKALSGRAIDEALLQETVDAYAHIPAGVSQYTLTEEYETFARPYSDIYNLIRSWTGMGLSAFQSWEADESALYEGYRQFLEANWKSIPLTETEKAFWREKVSQIETPFVYMYHEGYENMLLSFMTIGVEMLLFAAVCLPNLFADEHSRRTDQLVLCSVGGKSRAYWAKILAGVTVSVTAAALMSGVDMALCIGIYGPEGFDMPYQSCFSMYSYPITIGQACLIAYGVLIVTSVLAAVFVMVVSELLRSAVAALSISTALIILGNVILIPTQYRVIAQIWDWLPITYLSPWNVFDPRTLTLFGHCFVSWQVVPVLYILLSIALALGGSCIYRRYQVSGR